MKDVRDYRLVAVLDVADDEREFQGYVTGLWHAGIWLSLADRLEDVARSVIDPAYEAPTEPSRSRLPFSPEERRLLVALTWPNRNGGQRTLWQRPELASDDPRLLLNSIRPVTPRTYLEVWGDVRDNLKFISDTVFRAGFQSGGEIFGRLARLGLIRGGEVSAAVVDRLMEDAIRRTWWSGGYLLNLRDILDVAEACQVRFGPVAESGGAAFRLDREALWQRIHDAEVSHRILAEIPDLIRVRREQLGDSQRGPVALHRLITAGGLIVPPAVGTKYRTLFERLDADPVEDPELGTVLSREELEGLVMRHKDEGVPAVRGARGGTRLAQQRSRIGRLVVRTLESRSPNAGITDRA